MGAKNFYVALYKVDFITNGKQNNVEDNKQIMNLQTFFDNVNDFSQSPFCKDVGALEFYIFTYKCEIFIIISCQTYVYSGWNEDIERKMKSFINHPHNQVGSISFTDHTYSKQLPKEKTSRRLRSLGGGLRKILSLIKGGDESLTNKEIIKDLKHQILSGDEEKLKSQICAVEKNAKNLYEEKQQSNLSPSTAPSHVSELSSREAVNHKNRIVARCKDNLCNNTETQADHYRGAFEDENLVAYPTPDKGSEHGAVLTTSVHMHVANLY